MEQEKKNKSKLMIIIPVLLIIIIAIVGIAFTNSKKEEKQMDNNIISSSESSETKEIKEKLIGQWGYIYNTEGVTSYLMHIIEFRNTGNFTDLTYYITDSKGYKDKLIKFSEESYGTYEITNNAIICTIEGKDSSRYYYYEMVNEELKLYNSKQLKSRDKYLFKSSSWLDMVDTIRDNINNRKYKEELEILNMIQNNYNESCIENNAES